MPHFVVELSADDTVKRVLRDGVPAAEAMALEQLFSVVTTYFQLAKSNLALLTEAEQSQDRRGHGLQSFLMSLTGLEAFTNTYFHLRGQELENTLILNRAAQTHGSLTKKLRELIGLANDPPLYDQQSLLARVFELTQLRHEIVHPRWAPSSLLLAGTAPMMIQGLVENRQALFESEQFCREALFWCLLVVARIAESRGHSDVSGFMFHWTGNYGLTLPAIIERLGLDGGK